MPSDLSSLTPLQFNLSQNWSLYPTTSYHPIHATLPRLKSKLKPIPNNLSIPTPFNSTFTLYPREMEVSRGFDDVAGETRGVWNKILRRVYMYVYIWYMYKHIYLYIYMYYIYYTYYIYYKYIHMYIYIPTYIYMYIGGCGWPRAPHRDDHQTSRRLLHRQTHIYMCTNIWWMY
jgi:hypothetical protein